VRSQRKALALDEPGLLKNLTRLMPASLRYLTVRRMVNAGYWNGVEVTFRELKSGLHWGQMQVTKEKERVQRAMLLPVMTYVLLLRWYGKEEKCGCREYSDGLVPSGSWTDPDVCRQRLSEARRKYGRDGVHGSGGCAIRGWG
jgi:hypothetical protein